MDTDDLEPIIKPKTIDFDTLSIEELKEYIEQLQQEIKKAQNFIEKKEKDKITAEDVFKG